VFIISLMLLWPVHFLRILSIFHVRVFYWVGAYLTVHVTSGRKSYSYFVTTVRYVK
jgi:hypothetical protein